MKDGTEREEQVRVKDLTFSYPKRNPVLKGVSFSARSGEIVGITGLSGSGKTTLLHCIAGVIPHVKEGNVKGEVYIGGEDISDISLAEISQKTGIIFQDPDNRMVSTTVEDEIAFVLENMCLPPEKIRNRVEEMLEMFQLTHLRLRRPELLSGGEKQLLAAASVLAADPCVIVMDEPVSHLDQDGRKTVRDLILKIRKEGKTVLIAEHDFFQLDIADRILFLENGVITKDGRPEEMISFLENYFSKEEGTGGRIKEKDVPHPSGSAVNRPPKQEPEEERGKAKAAAGCGDRGRAVTVRDLTFSYRSGPPVFEGFSAEFRAGKITALTGKNGCGKSTLVKNITGILNPSAGEILIDGRSTEGMNIAQIAEHIGFVMQNPYCQVLGVTVREEMEIGLRNRGIPEEEREERVSFYLDYFDLKDYADIFPGHLSIGEKQRLEMAAVMAAGADYLILDEPTASLDMKRRIKLGRLLQRLRDGGKGILIISHDEHFNTEYADSIIRMKS